MGRRADDGAAAVEFALVALPLFLLVFGIIQYGFVFYEMQGAAATARDAAGWAAEGITDCDAWDAAALDKADGFGLDSSLGPEISAQFDFPGSGRPTVEVTLTFSPDQLVPLVPVPGTITRTATADVENVPVDGVTGSCP